MNSAFELVELWAVGSINTAIAGDEPPLMHRPPKLVRHDPHLPEHCQSNENSQACQNPRHRLKTALPVPLNSI